MNPKVKQALKFASFKHGEKDQRRKYTNEPYIVHPIAVYKTVRGVGGTIEQQVAAVLHDIVEDTDTTLSEITEEFGTVVASYVHQLSDPARPEDGNREARFKINLGHIKEMSAAAQTIKLADIIDNLKTIMKYDPKFGAVYMAEKERILPYLSWGDVNLYRQLHKILYGH